MHGRLPEYEFGEAIKGLIRQFEARQLATDQSIKENDKNGNVDDETSGPKSKVRLVENMPFWMQEQHTFASPHAGYKQRPAPTSS